MKLAEGLMRDKAGGDGADMDDEDPDMEDWSDMDDDSDEGGEYENSRLFVFSGYSTRLRDTFCFGRNYF